jgi:hypothetical protein
MSRITFGLGDRLSFGLSFGLCIGLCSALAACVAPPIGARIGLSASGAASTAAATAAAPAASPEPAEPPPPAAAEPAPMVDAAPEALATSAPLTVGGEVAGTLPAEGLRRFPFTVAAKGRYRVELFIKAPVPGQRRCTDASGADVTVIDRDEARVGSQFGGFTWAHDSWQKHDEAVELTRGAYQVSVLAKKGCRVHFRVRVLPPE